jgi:hypothetical protein
MGVYDEARQHKEERHEVHDNITHVFSSEQFVQQLRVDIEEQQEYRDVFDDKECIYFHFILPFG